MLPHRYPSLRPYAPTYVLAALYIGCGTLFRIVLWWKFGRTADVSMLSLSWIIPAGIVNDVIQTAYLSLPLTLYLWLLPGRWHRTRAARILLWIGCVATLTGMLFLTATEYFFFEEFDARFNLVAFDYLMYPTEVIGDIRAEYPVGTLIVVALFVGAVVSWLLRKQLLLSPAQAADMQVPLGTRRQRVVPALAQVAVVCIAIAIAGTDTFDLSANRVANEIAANGASSFFRSARTSELDYHAFYAVRDSQANFATVAEFLTRQGGVLLHRDQGRLTRHFAGDAHGLGKLNVVVVVEEAFGAEFSKLYGSQHDLTPKFDAYAQRGTWFRNVYASGTRTVRGLEAISASFPPIPSVSILRRPNNEHIATWGSVMEKAGYHTSFIYGGYGYFDNMNYFFGNNGFDVVDRTGIDKVRFENIWGVSDEDLFDRALSYYDEQAGRGQPFFSLIMTTSNHKPFTFREGIPGVPASDGGRPAGVRYADFALGYFLDEAQRHAWFDNTLFVVVADHGARVYGKAEIPLRSYEIPMLFYAPKHVQPQRIETLTGQIDIAPTVLGLLGLEYDAPFFGTDVLACERTQCTGQRLVLFNHNYDVAAYRDSKLAVLGLGKETQTLRYDRDSDRYVGVDSDSELTDLTIAIYQTAYEQYQERRYQ
jgi:phosphoglycerol transferase MdoB-like AlkP superfamily enzyme